MTDKSKVEMLPLDVTGAKAGQGSAYKPTREADTTATMARMSILYGLSEGEVRGFGKNWTTEDMLKRIYIAGTPIMAADGTRLQDVEVDFRSGTLDQTAIEGMPSVTVETPISTEVRFGAPVSRTFLRPNVTAFDIRISVPQLFRNTDKGDSYKSTVEFAIDVSINGGSFEQVERITLTEKITNGFQRTYTIKVPKGNSRAIRVRKLTEDKTGDFERNAIILDAITEVTEVKLRYPHTALLWVSYDARNYSSVPKVEVLLDGKSDLLIPSNYDPDTRTYATTGAGTTNGVWDGTFKVGYTDNPVWHWLDLATSKRYGLGNRITIDIPDKYYLYSLARYCDELVPDGKGGTEPRFTCNNMYLQKQEDAFTVFRDLSSVFRAKTIYDGANLIPRMDVPRDSMLVFSRANVKSFSTSSTSDAAQHNVVAVQFYDTENMYKSKFAYARDIDNIKRRGKVEKVEVTALGCVSEGQAQRYADFLLKAETTETELITFTTGLDGMRPIIGDVFTFADNVLAGTAVSGRVASVDGTRVTLDRPVDASVFNGGTFLVNTTEQFLSQRRVTNISADGMVLTLESAITVTDITGLVWALRSDSLSLREYVIDDIKYDPETNTYAISGISYNRNKYAESDTAARLVAPPVTIQEPLFPLQPSEVTASYTTVVDQGINIAKIDVAWSQSTRAALYELEMRRDGGTWAILTHTPSLTFTVDNAYLGNYEFRVRAIDVQGNSSAYVLSNVLAVVGKVAPPPMVQNLRAEGVLFGVRAYWDIPANATDTRSTRLEVRYGSSLQVNVYDVAYPAKTLALDALQANLTVTVRAALVDSYGTVGAFSEWVETTTSADPEKLLEMLEGHIGLEAITEELAQDIADGAAAKAAAEAAQTAASNATQAANSATTVANEAKTAATNANTAATNAQTAANNAVATANSASTAATNAASAAATATNTANAAKTAADSATATANTARTTANTAKTTADTAKSTADTAKTTADNAAAAVTTTAAAIRQEIADEVSALEDGITAETTARTQGDASLLSNLNAYKTSNDASVASVATKAQSAVDGLSSLSSTVTALSNTVDGKASNAAVSSLTSRVTAVEGTTTAQGQSITDLTSSLATTNTNVSNAATAAQNAMNAANAKGKVIFSSTAPATADRLAQNLWIDTANNANTPKRWNGTTWAVATDKVATDALAAANAAQTTANSKADASAVTALTNRVTQTEADISTQSSSITTLRNDLNTTTTAAGNAATAAQEAMTATGSKGKVIYSSTAPVAADRLSQNLWIDTTGSANTPKRWNGTSWVAVTDKVATDALAAANAAQATANTKADASAVTALSTRVTNAEGINTTQGTSITNLQNSVSTINNTLSTKADSSAVTTLENRVTQAEGNITTHGTSITSLQGSLATTNTNVTAAQTAAQNAMTAANAKGKVIFSSTAPATAERLSQNLWIDTTGNANTPKRWNGSAWVVVTDKVATDALAAANAAQATANTKADASALTSLSQTVTAIDGRVSANANSITNLNTALTNGLNTKLDASVISNYYTKSETTTEANRVAETVASGKVDEFRASLRIGAANLFNVNKINNLALSSTIASATAYRGYSIKVAAGDVYSISRPAIEGNRFRYAFTQTLPAAGVAYFGGTGNASTHDNALKIEGITVPEGAEYLFLYLSNASDTITKVMVEKGSLSSDWQPSYEEVQASIGANATAIQNVDTRVTQVDGKTTTNANAITTLRSDMNTALGTKLNASVISNYYTKSETETKADQIANTVASGKVDEFKSSLRIGGGNLQAGTKLFSSVTRYGGSTLAQVSDASAQTDVVRSTQTGTGASGFAYSGADVATVVIKNGGTYTLSFKVRGTVTPNYVYLMRASVNAANRAFIAAANNPTISETDFKLFTFSVNALRDANDAYVMISSMGAAGWFEVAEVMLQEGNTATAWSESSLDVAKSLAANATAIQNVDTRVTQVDGKTTTNANAITTLRSDMNTALNSKLNASAIGNYYTKAETTTEANRVADTVAAGKVDEFKAKLTNIAGKNLFSVAAWQTKPPLMSSSVPAMEVQLLPNTTYTLSTNFPFVTSQYNVFVHNIGGVASSSTNGVGNGAPRTFTTDSTGKVIVAARTYALDTSFNYWIQIELGSSATAFTPHIGDLNSVLESTASAIQTTNAEVTRVEGKVDSNTSAITALNTTVTGLNNSKADASALNALTTRVTATETTNTSQGTAITNLQNTINHATTGLATKASTSALNSLSNTVTQQGNTLTAHNTQLTNLASDITSINGQLTNKADATAVSNLTTRVTNNENTTSSQGTAITNLTNDVSTINADLTDATELARLMTSAKQLNTDPTFRDGASGIGGYRTNTANTLNRVVKPTDNPTTSTHELVVTSTGQGTTNGSFGGFVRSITSRANAVFVTKYIIKMPVGYRIGLASNAIGTGSTDKILGSNTGTGRYETYFRVTKCGHSGTFSTSGHVVFQGSPVPTAENPVTFHIASVEQYDCTDYLEVSTVVTNALDTLDTFTGRTGNSATSLANKITSLESTVNNPSTGVAATASGLSSLNTRVSTAEGNISSVSTQVTNLSNTVNHATTGLNSKASNTAVSALDTRVTAAEGSLANQSSSITTLTNNLASVKTTADGALQQVSPLEGSRRLFKDVLRYFHSSSSYSGLYVIKTPITPTSKMFNIMMRGFNYNSQGNSAIDVQMTGYCYTASNPLTNDNVVNKGAMPMTVRYAIQGGTLIIILSRSTVTFAYTQFTLDAEIGYTAPPATWKDGWSVSLMTEAELTADTSITYLRTPNTFDTVQESKATSSALSSLTSTVTQQGSTITSQGTQLTTLQNAVNHATTGLSTKASTATVNALESRIVAEEGKSSTFTSDITQLKADMTAANANINTRATTAALNALTNRVTATETGITANVSDLTTLEAKLQSSVELVSVIGNQASLTNINRANTELVDEALSVTGKVIELRGNANVASKTKMPFDPNKMYRMRVRYKRKEAASGVSNRMYIAIVCWDATLTRTVTTANNLNAVGTFVSNTIYPQSNVLPALDTWITQEWFINGKSTGSSSGTGTKTNPYVMPAQTAALDVGMLPNYLQSSLDNVYQIDYMYIEDVTLELANEVISNAYNDLNTRVTNTEGTLTSQGTSITGLNSSITTINDVITIKDTRSTNQPPSWYWTNFPRRTVNEFKSQTTIGVNNFFGGTYCNLETSVPYIDSSGGHIVQTATSSADPTLYVQRVSTSTSAWGAWTQPIKDLRDTVSGKADASAVSSLTTRVSNAEGTLSSQATALTNLTSTVNGQTTTISQQATTINGIQASYTVKINNNGYSTGFGLVSTGANGTPSTAFKVDADAFEVGKSGTGIKPFVVVTSSNQTINGVTYPAAGTYIHTAFIANGTLTTAHIKDLSVTAAKIANAAITTAKIGDLQVDTIKIKDNAVTSLIDSVVPNNTTFKKTSAFIRSGENILTRDPEPIIMVLRDKVVFASGLRSTSRYVVFYRGNIYARAGQNWEDIPNSMNINVQHIHYGIKAYLGNTKNDGTGTYGTMIGEVPYAYRNRLDNAPLNIQTGNTWNIAEIVPDDQGEIAIWFEYYFEHKFKEFNYPYGWMTTTASDNLSAFIMEFKK